MSATCSRKQAKQLYIGIVYSGGAPHVQAWEEITRQQADPFAWKFLEAQKTIREIDSSRNPDRARPRALR